MGTKAKKLIMAFDPNTIEHLGIRMYSTLPPVLAELVSNSYDADANNVNIVFDNNDPKSISISDDGHGMTFDQINSSFLLIGRNRRKSEGQKSQSGKRNVIGKKGIGKLSFFGIASEIEITTIRDGKKTSFSMDWEKLKKAGDSRKPYEPELKIRELKTTDPSGTEIKLLGLKRKSDFDLDSIAFGLSKKFNVFNEPDFETTLKSASKAVTITNELKYSNIDSQFTWDFPNPTDLKLGDYEYSSEISGQIIAAKETVPSSDEGIALFSRGKLVNEHEFFDAKATSFGYKYITGILNIDFIDEWDRDVISTNRKSLIWEDEQAAELKKYLNSIVLATYNALRKEQKVKKKKEIKEKTGIDIDEWILKLPRIEQKLAKNLTDKILTTDGITVDKSTELIGFVQDSFQYEAFKEIATSIDESDDDPSLLVSLLQEWQVIEAREFYRISKVRIQTIEQFEKHIDNNSKEVPEMHEFFKTFPWILDPRIMNFQDEVTYSKLLREKFKEDKKVPKEDKRIDFLCQNFAESTFIIELKRPQATITSKNLDQGLEYLAFIKKHINNETPKNVHCYIVGGKLSSHHTAQEKADSYSSTGKVYFKPYLELLKNAKQYHREFIEKHKQFEK